MSKYIIIYYQDLAGVFKLCTYVCENEFQMIGFLEGIAKSDNLTLVSVVAKN